MTQVREPVGDHDAWLVSLWVKEDPARGVTVPQLVSLLEGRSPDHGDLHRRLLRAGYSHASRSGYTTKFVMLAEPEWYPVSEVPTIREVDPGVSDIRYRVTLDAQTIVNPETALGLWKHFLGREYASVNHEAG